MNTQRITAATDVAETLKGMLDGMEHDRLFVLTDEHTEQWCYPLVAPVVGEAHRISIAAGDDNKDIEALCHVWDELSGHGATRHSLLINLGGGMVTDLGGFAAATFKRGIRCINVPTTLLAMVDAAVGGKTGINRHALKNEVGAFYPAEAVVVSAQFLHTLDAHNIASGFAEMLKHGLISTEEHWSRLIRYDLNGLDLDALQGLIMESISVKEHVVEQDPTEKHIRKALNLGHTLGHAFETWAMRHAMPILHGHAVAWGLIGELYLAHIHEGFPTDKLRQMVSYVKEVYEPIAFTCKDYDELHELMQHDKKNRGTEIRFTLLGGIGDIRIDCIATKEEIDEALDFVREC